MDSNDEGADELKKYRQDERDPFQEGPPFQELLSALAAPHDADAAVLQYLCARPNVVEAIQGLMDSMRPSFPYNPTEGLKNETIFPRLQAELERRKAAGERGGELLR